MTADRRLTLILGGARAGKSRYAEQLAKATGERVLFVATAEAGDEAMRLRIEAHRRSRPQHWRTVEAPLGVAEAIARQGDTFDVVLLDCLTLLVSNVVCQVGADDPEAEEVFRETRSRVESELRALIDWLEGSDAHLIVVSNEVGLGLVPPYPLGRAYRDLLGWANTWLAQRADKVLLMVAGLPLDIKALARQTGLDMLR